MKATNISQLIGNTPHLHLQRLFPQAEVWVKLEKNNPGGSIKDRIALSMIRDAEEKGILKPGSVIIEPTSGNTGLALAMVAASLGYKVILTMPESMSLERRRLIAVYGAELVLTPREKGMRGAIEKAQELAAEIPGAWIPMQFENPANPRIHAQTTAREIISDFPEGFDYLVTGVGTGGHISAVGEELKKLFPALKVIAVEPADSPVISGGQPGPHPIQGIGAGFIPKILNTAVLDEVITVTKEQAFDMARRVARVEGLFGGISSAASLVAVENIIEKEARGKKILTFNYDTGERYLSVEGLF